ncbi:hypothetical protein [Lapidilactobacillus wuchangensis]|nr:hypothetical protein [Lapidilactobacillus wuchangensis]
MSQNTHTGMNGDRRPINHTNVKKNAKAQDKVLATLKKLADADK